LAAAVAALALSSLISGLSSHSNPLLNTPFIGYGIFYLGLGSGNTFLSFEANPQTPSSIFFSPISFFDL